MRELIGLSLSGCVKDILEGNIGLEEVKFISAGTKINSKHDLLSVCGTYAQTYWKGFDLNEIMNILEHLFYSGKVIQPRVLGFRPIPSNKKWLVFKEYILSDFFSNINKERGEE